MQASKLRVGMTYVYCPAQQRTFDAWYDMKAYSVKNIFKVRVLRLNVERYSTSTKKYVNNGVEIEYLDTGADENRTEVVTANRLKREWSFKDEDHFKDELQRFKDNKQRRVEDNAKRTERVALAQYQSSVLEAEGVTITDVLEANGLVEGTDFVLEEYERGVVLRGDGITRLIEILGV